MSVRWKHKSMRDVVFEQLTSHYISVHGRDYLEITGVWVRKDLCCGELPLAQDTINIPVGDFDDWSYEIV